MKTELIYPILQFTMIWCLYFLGIADPFKAKFNSPAWWAWEFRNILRKVEKTFDYRG